MPASATPCASLESTENERTEGGLVTMRHKSCERCHCVIGWPGNWNLNRVRYCKDCRPTVKRERERARRALKCATRSESATTIMEAR